MQVMPIALRHYNENHSQQYTMADLRSKTSSAAAIQIRIGIWILGFFWKSAYRYLKSKLGTQRKTKVGSAAQTYLRRDKKSFS
jgi:hypothetical protein